MPQWRQKNIDELSTDTINPSKSMELDYLKKTWDSTTGVGGSFKSDMMIDLTRKTSLDRLLGNYRRFADISFGMTVFSLLFLSNRLFPQSAGIWITLYLMAYFLTTASPPAGIFAGGPGGRLRGGSSFRRKMGRLPWVLSKCVLFCKIGRASCRERV